MMEHSSIARDRGKPRKTMGKTLMTALLAPLFTLKAYKTTFGRYLPKGL